MSKPVASIIKFGLICAGGMLAGSLLLAFPLVVGVLLIGGCVVGGIAAWRSVFGPRAKEGE